MYSMTPGGVNTENLVPKEKHPSKTPSIWNNDNYIVYVRQNSHWKEVQYCENWKNIVLTKFNSKSISQRIFLWLELIQIKDNLITALSQLADWLIKQ
jgi:hypothetical protein